MEHIESIGVIGAGSWGTALANLLADKGYHIYLWVFEPELAKIIAHRHENTFYLPGHKISANVFPSTSMEDVVKGKRMLVMAVPSHFYRNIALQSLEYLENSAVIVSVTKGIEIDSLLTMSGIWHEILPPSKTVEIATLAGPSFACEVIRKLPTAVTVASRSLETARQIQSVFQTGYFRTYSSQDETGVELAGALKNVIAIAAGICDGLGFGHNARAALITRGLAEISRLGVKMGADTHTFSGLSGLGDLVLTCTGDLSRNRTVGLKLGQGMTLESILDEMRMVAEGIKTTKSVYHLAKREGIDMPICEKVYEILYEAKSCYATVNELMRRSLKDEIDR
ncbi:NAD(P)-dependent glycerol-3-phosphate dehydrogenase [bacterium]|nr:NAD(P)-dependent glycerol-3-phosphate dehydrogenase [bacterium]